MLKIYGRTTSSNVMKVLWACAELGLAYERIDIGGAFGGNRAPAYLAMNPNGLVPTIDDDGFILWESNAIVRYLAAKHGAGGLLPSDLRAQADAGRWMDWQLSVLGPAITPVFWQLIRTPAEKRDAAVLEAARQKTIEAFRILEARLADRDFVCGDTLTVGDIPVAVQVHRWLAMPVAREPIPHIERYYARLGSRPGDRQHVMPPLA